jgi:salicylate hydroxylase
MPETQADGRQHTNSPIALHCTQKSHHTIQQANNPIPFICLHIQTTLRPALISHGMGFQDKRVVVVGGGLGGMAFMNAALYAGLKNIQCYEQAHQFGEVGAGVDITANANRILDAFGLQESLVRRSSPQLPYYMQYHNYQSGEYLGHIEEFSQPHARLIHRAHLLDSLKEPIPEDQLHLQKRLAFIERNAADAPYTLYFEDGTTADADIVIGCDGIKSRVRRELGYTDSPTYSGQVVYRGFVEYKDLPEETATLLRNVVNFRGPKRHLLCLPIGNPATQTDRVGVIGFMTESLDSWDSENWMARAEISTLHEHVRDWCPQVQDIIKGLELGSPDGRMMKQALYFRDPLAKWYEMNNAKNAGIVLLGDAVHSTLPHQGKFIPCTYSSQS